jgi:branched-chain amino acid aminotransferase
MAPGLNYGQQCYEGLKAFRSPDDSAITIFRPDMNARRMQHSASFVSMPEIPVQHFEECVKAAVALNAEFVPPARTGAAMYIRPLLFGSSAQLGLSPPEEYTFVVWVLPVGVYHGVHSVPALILEDFDRAAPHGTGSAKVGGNYAPVLRFSDRARNDGFGITLHLDSRTRSEIDEFSTSAFLGVKQEGDSTTLVVPDSKNVIESVTADSVCEIAKKVFGWKVEKRAVSHHPPPSPSLALHLCLLGLILATTQINYAELQTFNEVFAAGTAAALVPIKSITMKSRNDTFTYLDSDEPGPACLKLLDQLKGIQTGRYEDTFGWNVKVEEGSREAFVESKGDESKGGNVDVMNA